LDVEQVFTHAMSDYFSVSSSQVFFQFGFLEFIAAQHPHAEPLRPAGHLTADAACSDNT